MFSCWQSWFHIEIQSLTHIKMLCTKVNAIHKVSFFFNFQVVLYFQKVRLLLSDSHQFCQLILFLAMCQFSLKDVNLFVTAVAVIANGRFVSGNWFGALRFGVCHSYNLLGISLYVLESSIFRSFFFLITLIITS